MYFVGPCSGVEVPDRAQVQLGFVLSTLVATKLGIQRSAILLNACNGDTDLKPAVPASGDAA